MRFGLLYMMYGDEPDDTRLYQEIQAQVAAAEGFGFDTVWFAEHHFDRGGDQEYCGRLPAPMLFAVAAAQHTSRIQVGTGVRVVSLHNPLVMAEESAVADLLSDGRFNFGVGQGVDADLQRFGVSSEDKHARFREMLDVIAGAWEPGELTYTGKYFNYDRVCVIPKPKRGAAQMLWVAARDTPTIQYAGAQGWPLLIGQAELTARQSVYADIYYKAAEAAGQTPRLAGTRLVYVSDAGSPERAREEIAQHVQRYHRRMRQGAYYQLAIREGLLSESAEPTLDEIFRNSAYIAGPPEYVANQLADVSRALRATTLNCMMHVAGMPHERVLRSLQLFQTEVKPRLLQRLDSLESGVSRTAVPA
jgi:alkanesulfonate monooxygenase SsuD/methylene tetrahydromethanopterin reductase-like flavin-dependent oxidoreductase (luciferase family)